MDRDPDPRRRLRLAVYLLAGRLNRLAAAYSAGALTAGQFMTRGRLLLARSHTEAAQLGRTLAGQSGPVNVIDALWGEQAAQQDYRYLRGLADDLAAGRYEDEENGDGALQRRALLYGQKLVATANRSWTYTLNEQTDGEVRYLWTTHAAESCPDCIAESEEPARTYDELDRMPGDGSTACKSNCACSLQADDGTQGFSRAFR